MQAKLIVVGGKADQSEIDLQLPTTIGRQRDSDLVIVHKSVSRLHCQLFERNGSLIVRDNNSSNGTYINDLQVFEAVIRPGDFLRVGPLTFEARYSLVRPAKAKPEPIPLERPPIREAELDIDPDALPDTKAAPTGDESDELDLSAWNLNMADGGDQESGDDEAPFVFSDSPDDSLIGQQMAADAPEKPKSKVEFDFEDWGLSEEEKIGETIDADVPSPPPHESISAPKADNRSLDADFTGFKPGAAANADSSSIGIVSHDFDDPAPPKKSAKPATLPPKPSAAPKNISTPKPAPPAKPVPPAKPLPPPAKPAPSAKPVLPPLPSDPISDDNLTDESDDFGSWMTAQAVASDIAAPAPDAATSTPPEQDDLDILQDVPIEITADDLAPDSQIGQLSPVPQEEKKIPDPLVDDFNSWGKENIDSDSDFDSDIESILPTPTPPTPPAPPKKAPNEDVNSFFSSFVEGDSLSIDEEKSAVEKKPNSDSVSSLITPSEGDEVSELTLEDIAESGIHQNDFLTNSNQKSEDISNDVEDDPAQFNFDNWK